ncbi:MAG: hypothetical protein VYB44_07305 [Bacteroidota bacterium]|nr:hypothetical protein [Bacteroidota bacterium]
MNIIEELEKVIKHHTNFITDENQNKWRVLEVSDIEEIINNYNEFKDSENLEKHTNKHQSSYFKTGGF